MVFEFCKCNSASEIYPRFYSLLDAIRIAWAGPTQPARKPVKFVAFLSQIPPSGPFLPVVPVYNHCTVNNLRFAPFLDTEEVAGSSPVVPTILIKNLQLFLRFCPLQNGSTKVQVKESPFHPAFAKGGVAFGQHHLDYLGLGGPLVLRECLSVHLWRFRPQ